MRQEDSGQAEADSGEEMKLDPDPRTIPTSFKKVVQSRAGIVWANSRQRPDIALAGLVLLGAIARVIGIRRLSTLAISAVTVAAILYWQRHQPRPATSVPTSDVSTHQEEVQSAQTLHANVIDTLQDFLNASKSLDQVVETSLSLLQETRDETHTHQALRVALHHLTEQMTDHLGTATSTFLEMVDKEELGVLGEMYDIPVVGSFLYPRNGLGRHPRDLTTDSHHYTLLSPTKASSNASSNLIPLALPMGASASMPSRLSPHQKHTIHSSLSGLPADDRYTSLPPRTPRASKRSSWAPEWNDRIKTGFDNERRITGSDGGGEIESTSQGFDEEQHRTLIDSTSPSPKIPQFTPRKSSPLSRTDSTFGDVYQRHIFPIIPPTPLNRPLMPSPMARSPLKSESKRQSLQGMPYYRSDQSDIASPGKASLPAGGDLRRVPSLQYSDLQMLREQSTRGSRRPSASSNVNPFAPSLIPLIAPVTQSLERPRPQRILSLSPLTLPALKASCLGVHMKRRRMACCLLGLQFDQVEEYWNTARDTLRDLVASITTEVTELNAALANVREVQVAVRNNLADPLPPPWAIDNTTDGGFIDFAPRTSDHETLNKHVEIMEQSLNSAWAELQAVKQTMSSTNGLMEEWTKVRGRLGELIREWERGKEIVSRMEPLPPHSSNGDEDTDQDDSMPLIPAFIKAWDDDEPKLDASQSSDLSSCTTDMELSGNDLDYGSGTDYLPPPGQDMVFESTPLSVDESTIARSKLSREERIKLVKEARDKGMTVGDMLNTRDQDGMTNGHPNARQVMEMGGKVVGELKGMIGMIRRRKGLDEDTPTPVPPRNLSPVKQDTSTRMGAGTILARPVSSERLRPPAGFTEDLRKAFVFPPPRLNGHSDR